MIPARISEQYGRSNKKNQGFDGAKIMSLAGLIGRIEQKGDNQINEIGKHKGVKLRDCLRKKIDG